ncbi:hypothetical protein STEG23_015450 [Scotinomys teguina]
MHGSRSTPESERKLRQTDAGAAFRIQSPECSLHATRLKKLESDVNRGGCIIIIIIIIIISSSSSSSSNHYRKIHSGRAGSPTAFATILQVVILYPSVVFDTVED